MDYDQIAQQWIDELEGDFMSKNKFDNKMDLFKAFIDTKKDTEHYDEVYDIFLSYFTDFH